MPKVFFVSCFEPSGDAIGAYLVRSLRAEFGTETRIVGIAGPQMREAGIEEWGKIEDLNVMGIIPVLKAAPKLLKLIKNLAARVDRLEPDCIITIDAPDFHVRLMEKMQKHQCPRAQLVSPSVWAWRAKRVLRFAKVFDVMYCIFPFEAKFYEATNLRTLYVGHPSVKMALDDEICEEVFSERFPNEHNILLLPGSRPSELKRLRDDFLIIKQGLDRDRKVTWLIPTLEQHRLALEEWFADSDNVEIITDKAWRFAAMRYGNVALCCMGTVELELSLRNCPHIALYRFKPLDNLLRRLFRFSIDHGSLSNILMNQEVIPEYLQDAIDHDQIIVQMSQLLDENSTLYQQQRESMQKIQNLLHSPKGDFATSISADVHKLLKL